MRDYTDEELPLPGHWRLILVCYVLGGAAFGMMVALVIRAGWRGELWQ